MSREVYFNDCSRRRDGYLNIDLFPPVKASLTQILVTLKIVTKLVVIFYYCTLYSLSVFSLAKSLQLILEINTTYRFVSYLLVDN